MPIGEDTDKRNYIVSNAKIEAAGFKPDVSLQAGIAELVKGYKIIRRGETEDSNSKGNIKGLADIDSG